MFSWFKAKTPKPVKEWEIQMDGCGNCYVRHINKSITPKMDYANLHFRSKQFGNIQQAETAISDWERKQILSERKTVKYL